MTNLWIAISSSYTDIFYTSMLMENSGVRNSNTESFITRTCFILALRWKIVKKKTQKNLLYNLDTILCSLFIIRKRN